MFDLEILEFWNFFSSKSLLIDSPLMPPPTIFLHMKFEKFCLMRQNFDEVQKMSNFGPVDMSLGSTFEISTQIILLQIDGFLQRLDFKYHPS